MRTALAWLVLVASTSVAAAEPKLPAKLDRAAINKGIATVKSDVKNCQSLQYDGKTVTATIQVGPYGNVLDVKTKGASPKDPRLEPCVKGWLVEAVFPATKQGGTVTYPFKFYPAVRPYMPTERPEDLLNEEPLSKADEDAGLATVKDKIDACYAATKLARAVRVRTHFYVTDKGKVENVKAKATAGDQLETCMTDALAAATFKASTSSHQIVHTFILVPAQ
jgi:hypothetical protein